MPDKRRQSPPVTPPPNHVGLAMPTKRSPPQNETLDSTSTDPKRQHTISDLFPYQELFLRILSFLSPTDLALVQGVSKYWAKMSLDPQVSITLSLLLLPIWPMPPVCVRCTEQMAFSDDARSCGNISISVSKRLGW